MCHGDPSICRCGWCFVARMDPSKFTGNPGILGPGPFREALAEYEKKRYEKKDDFKVTDLFKPAIDLTLIEKVYRKNKDSD
ncbi:MAG: hypothetical protein QW666_02365 [Candidatus Woesearchaeota archaeon]